MRRHIGVSAVDLRIVETGLDHRGPGVIRHQKLRHAADGFESAGVRADPIGDPLGPGGLRKSEVGRTQYGNEDLRVADFAGEPIDNDGHAIASVIDEQLPRGSGASSQTAAGTWLSSRLASPVPLR